MNLAVLEDLDAVGVRTAGNSLVVAVFLDTLFRRRSEEGDCGLKFFDFRLETFVLLGALCNIDSRLVMLSAKAEFPAASLGATLLLTFFESRYTLGVFLACSPFIGTLLFNTLLGISNLVLDFECRSDEEKRY